MLFDQHNRLNSSEANCVQSDGLAYLWRILEEEVPLQWQEALEVVDIEI